MSIPPAIKCDERNRETARESRRTKKLDVKKIEGSISKTRVKKGQRCKGERKMNPSDLISCDRNDVMNFSM